MWTYEKKLQYPVRIKNSNPKLAKIIIAQYGGLYSINYKWAIKALFGAGRHNPHRRQIIG